MGSNISVIVAVYNGERYLSDQIKSILSQSVSVDEIIIVDDASQDDSASLIERFALIEKKIKFVKNRYNIGLKSSLELAMSMVSSKFIALADQDDIWSEDRILKCIPYMDDGVLIVCGFKCIDRENKACLAHPVLSLFEKVSSLPDPKIKKYVKYNSILLGCTMLFDLRYYKEKMYRSFSSYPLVGHDHIISAFFSCHGKIKIIPEPLIYYRIHDAQNSKSMSVYHGESDTSNNVYRYPQLSGIYELVLNLRYLRVREKGFARRVLRIVGDIKNELFDNC